MIKFMDNKLKIAGGMFMRLRGKYHLSLEAQVFYHYGYTAAEYDVVLLAWKEKARHDLIRPTSLVQDLGDLEVTSFVGTHKAKDWVPFTRVMPINLEFGVVEDEARTPLVASLLSFGLFVVGSLPSVIPFFFSKDPKHGLIAAGISTTTALLAVGALKTWATRGKCLIAAFENLVIAGCGGALAYGVGVLFDTIIR
jgi:VIT1/CCC1 family predicted Fe2+/Mn2+ transporter